MKGNFFDHPLCCWLHTWTTYRNLAIFFNWSNYGYWKSQKALEFSTFNFYDNVIGDEKKLVGSDFLHIEDGSIVFLRWVHFGAFRVSWMKNLNVYICVESLFELRSVRCQKNIKKCNTMVVVMTLKVQNWWQSFVCRKVHCGKLGCQRCNGGQGLIIDNKLQGIELKISFIL